jgi:hypothetical protein
MSVPMRSVVLLWNTWLQNGHSNSKAPPLAQGRKNFNLRFSASENDHLIRVPVFSPALSEAAREWYALGRSY